MEPAEIVQALTELADEIERLRDGNEMYVDSALRNIYEAIGNVKDMD